MANPSIYNAFERMWYHINNKIDEITADKNDALDFIENMEYVDLVFGDTDNTVFVNDKNQIYIY